MVSPSQKSTCWVAEGDRQCLCALSPQKQSGDEGEVASDFWVVALPIAATDCNYQGSDSFLIFLELVFVWAKLFHPGHNHIVAHFRSDSCKNYDFELVCSMCCRLGLAGASSGVSVCVLPDAVSWGSTWQFFGRSKETLCTVFMLYNVGNDIPAAGSSQDCVMSLIQLALMYHCSLKWRFLITGTGWILLLPSQLQYRHLWNNMHNCKNFFT